jgi:hypothetical protein
MFNWPMQILFFRHVHVKKGNPGATVKLLPCDQEVVVSSPRNSFLQQCRGRLFTLNPKWSGLSPDPAQVGATCIGLPFLVMFM